jgi:predicted PurR-regulated permease PerM
LRQWQTWEVVLVRYVQDFIFHVVCALAGFLGLFFSVAALQEFKALAEVPAGAAVLIVFSFLLGLVGVCGQLPFLLLEGRFPKGG